MAEGAGKIDAEAAKKLHRALTEGTEGLFVLLDETSPEVLRAFLKNPALDENHLRVLLKRSDLPEDVVVGIYRLPAVEGSHRLKVALARNPHSPAQIVLSLIPQLHLFELVELSLLPAATPDQKAAAERNIIRRLPAVPLGTKMTLARRATASVAEALLQESDPRVVEICLSNPRLSEGAVFRFLGSAKATPEAISVVARHDRWKGRPGLRLPLLKNPRTPMVWFVLHLPRLSLADLRGLLLSRKLTAEQKKGVEAEMRFRETGRRGNR